MHVHAAAAIGMLKLVPKATIRPACKNGHLACKPDQMTAVGGVSRELHAGVEAILDGQGMRTSLCRPPVSTSPPQPARHCRPVQSFELRVVIIVMRLYTTFRLSDRYILRVQGVYDFT